MICKTCGKYFEEDYRTDHEWIKKHPIPDYCSRSCSKKGRVVSSETRALKSIQTKAAWERGELKGHHFTQDEALKGSSTAKENLRKKSEQALREGRYEDLPFNVRRQVIFEEAKYTCQVCGNALWLDKPIWLEIHHKNGNHQDNRKENLLVVCLNCHATVDPHYRRVGREPANKKTW